MRHRRRPDFYAPFVWNGNALDQKILDAQAQMLPPPRRRIQARFAITVIAASVEVE